MNKTLIKRDRISLVIQSESTGVVGTLLRGRSQRSGFPQIINVIHAAGRVSPPPAIERRQLALSEQILSELGGTGCLPGGLAAKERGTASRRARTGRDCICEACWWRLIAIGAS